MFKMFSSQKRGTESDMSIVANLSRRKFLGITGAGAGAITLAACGKDDDSGVNLGSGDVGILNYAYALEQLEAAFYTRVIASPYANISDAERLLLTDIRDHEIAHREFFKAALTATTGATVIPALEVNFSSINFADRTSVLTTARTFEDLGVAAYNGAGKLITTSAYLVLAGKIVSVEARHAAYIRDLISNGTFADNTTNGLDGAMTPSAVLSAAAPFISTKINASNLPTS